jgi:hypothetical protein
MTNSGPRLAADVGFAVFMVKGPSRSIRPGRPQHPDVPATLTL